MRSRSDPASGADAPPYVPPQPHFGPCVICRQLVACVVDTDGTHEHVTPALGDPHDCAIARANWAPIAQYLAGDMVATFVTLPDGKEVFTWMKLAPDVTLAELAGQELEFRIEQGE
jgi:hypothetical protein